MKSAAIALLSSNPPVKTVKFNPGTRATTAPARRHCCLQMRRVNDWSMWVACGAEWQKTVSHVSLEKVRDEAREVEPCGALFATCASTIVSDRLPDRQCKSRGLDSRQLVASLFSADIGGRVRNTRACVFDTSAQTAPRSHKTSSTLCKPYHLHRYNRIGS